MLEIPLASTLFLLLFASSIVGYLRDRTPVGGMVVLVFGAVSPLFASRLLGVTFGFTAPQAWQAAMLLGVLAQPLLTLGLASLLERGPRWALPAAALGFLLTAPAVVLMLPSPTFSVIVAAVAVYVATALAAAGYFLRASAKRIGSARLRLAMAAGATILSAATLMILASAAALPTPNELISTAARYGVLFASILYALAFLTPGWLRRQWGAQTAYELSRRLLTGSTANDAAQTWRLYLEMASAAAGARHGAVVVGQAGRAATTVVGLGALAEGSSAWLPAEFEEVLDGIGGVVHGRPDQFAPIARRFADTSDIAHMSLIPFSLPRQQSGILVLASDRHSLFTHDDEELFETLGLEAGVLADRAQASAEQLVLRDRLLATVDALRAAHQAKSDFLASMSHELRTPLNAILGFSDLMRSEPELDGRRAVPKDWIEHVNVAGRHLLELINDVLDLAKVEAGRLDLRREQVRVESAVAESIAGLRPLIEQKKLHVTTRVDLPPIMLDRSRLRQILYNLLSNAIKYTPAGGTISIEAAVEASEPRISVSDTGIGIAPADQERIFEEFTQVGDPESRQGGTGLGLALTRRLVEAHDGRIELESAPGQGSRFTIVLTPASLDLVEATTREQAGPLSVPLDAGAAPLVLVIEDDPQAVVLLRSYLEPSGYRVAVASDGQAGVASARAAAPAAILLDVLLPGDDGWDVLRQLKADPQLRDIPVLMVTVVDEREVGLALGAVDYIVKPIERQALLDALARHVPTPRNGRRPRVLAVDDDPVARSIIAAALEDFDCEVTLADGGRQALVEAARGPIDFVICDLVMPDLDGFEVVAHLKADPKTREVPILILTGQSLTDADKNRLNGKIVGIREKGADVPASLRDWLARVSAAPPSGT